MSRAVAVWVSAALAAFCVAVAGGTAGAQVTGTVAGFCQARVDVGSAANSTFTARTKALREAAEFGFEGALLRLESNAPAATQADVATIVNAVRTKGVEKAFQDPAVEAAGKRIDAFAVNNCGYPVVKANANDYQFSNIPATMKTGNTSLQLTNNAPKERHEMVVFRRNPGVTDSAQKLVNMPQKKAMKKVTFVDGIDELAPGETGYTLTNLTPGQYVFACFLPQAGKKNGTSHASLGMIAESTVAP